MATLRKGEQVWYEFLPERDFVLKLYRVKGFPLFKVFKCIEEKYAECLSNYKSLFEAGLIDFSSSEEKVKDNLDKGGLYLWSLSEILQRTRARFEKILEILRDCLKTRQKGKNRANLADGQIKPNLPD